MTNDWTISAASMAAMAGVGLFTLLFPLILAVLFWRRRGGRWRFFLLGCVVFPLFALTLEGSINRAVLYGPAGAVIAGNIWLYGLFGGLMAGVFEECGRYAAFRLGRRWTRGPQDALMYGAGHGGIEAVLLVGSAMLNSFLIAQALNRGGISGVEALMGVPLTEAGMASLEQMASIPAALYLVSGVERLFAMVIHISLSVLVYTAAVRRERWYWFPAAIGLHALVDFAAVVTSPVSTLLTEVLAAVLAVGLALLARRVYLEEKAETLLTFHQGEGVS